jgi:trimeric autotransporter adhesin
LPGLFSLGLGALVGCGSRHLCKWDIECFRLIFTIDKEAIQPMDKVSQAIHPLQPVTFRYKQELDPDGIPQFGLVAEDVAKVNPDLVARDEEGKPYTVRYEAVNAMLLNEFLKEHRKNQQQEATIGTLQSTLAQEQSANAEQKKELEALKSALKKQAAQRQKLSARLEANTPATRVADNR